MLNFQLSPELVELQKKAREFALKEILPVAWYYDEVDETPMAVRGSASPHTVLHQDAFEDRGLSTQRM